MWLAAPRRLLCQTCTQRAQVRGVVVPSSVPILTKPVGAKTKLSKREQLAAAVKYEEQLKLDELKKKVCVCVFLFIPYFLRKFTIRNISHLFSIKFKRM